jgi:hypothetical protein
MTVQFFRRCHNHHQHHNYTIAFRSTSATVVKSAPSTRRSKEPRPRIDLLAPNAAPVGPIEGAPVGLTSERPRNVSRWNQAITRGIGCDSKETSTRLKELPHFALAISQWKSCVQHLPRQPFLRQTACRVASIATMPDFGWRQIRSTTRAQLAL